MNEEPAPDMRCRCGKTGLECLRNINNCNFLHAGREAGLRPRISKMPKTAGGKKGRNAA